VISPDQISLAKDVGYGVAIAGFQAYNIWQHEKTKAHFAQTDAAMAVQVVKFDDVKADLDAARAAIDRINARYAGPERRRAPAAGNPLSGAAQNLGRRLGDRLDYTGGNDSGTNQ
jgi:hypothetical protein